MRSIFSKTCTKFSKMQSNGRVNLNPRAKPVRDPETSVFFIPLGSPTGVSKQPYVTARVYTGTAGRCA